jgi:exosortase
VTFDSLLALILFTVGGSLFLLERVPLFQREMAVLDGRWITNLGLMVVSGFIFALFLPVSPYAAAEMQTSGLLSRLNLSTGSQIIFVFLGIDFWRYWEHRIFHKVSFFWRVHLVHHSDTFVDITTSERHHPLEALITTPLVILLIFILGLPAEGLAVYLLAATVSSLWVHSNLRTSQKVDMVLRRLLVTPAVHAIHHSSEKQQTNSNYGSVLTIWDRLFSTYNDPSDARIPHFGLEYFHQARDTRLIQVLLQPVLYHKAMVYPSRKVCSDPISQFNMPALSREWQQTLICGALGLCLVILLMWPTIINLISHWSSDSYQYAWLILPLLVYVLGWHYRDEILSLSPQPDFKGVALIAGGAILWLVAAIVHIDLGKSVAFVLILQGILISVLGLRIWLRLFPIFALLFFMIPSGDVLQLPLRNLTVNMIDWFASLASLPHSIEGFVIYIGEHRYVVVNECSGLSFVTLAMFLSYSWAILMYSSFSKIVCMTLMGGLLGITANALRVNIVIWLDWINDTQMNLSEHSNIQLIILSLMLGVLFLIVSRLQPESRIDFRQQREQKNDSEISWKRYTPVVAGILVVCTVNLAQLMMSAVSRDELHMSVASLTPVNPGILSSSQSGQKWNIDEESRTGSLSLSFKGDFDVLIVQALPGNNKLPSSSFVPQGDKVWREASVENQTACLHESCFNFIHTTWNRKNSNDLQHIFYTYHVGDFITDSRYIYRMVTGWNQLTGLNKKSGMISFITIKEPPKLNKLAEAYMQIKAQI